MLWGCFKPDQPFLDQKKQKPIKYEHPKGIERGSFFLQVPWTIAYQISQSISTWDHMSFQDHCPIPTESLPGDSWEDDRPLPEDPKTAVSPQFWPWVCERPEVPVILTEGAKKAGCLLSHGYAAVGLPGIHGGYRTLTTPLIQQTIRELVPTLHCIANPGRTIYLCFDQDSKPKTQHNVQIALQNLGHLLKERGVTVKVIRWPGSAKGIDDLVVEAGPEALDRAVQQAELLEDWHWSLQQQRNFTYPPQVNLNLRELSIETIDQNSSQCLAQEGTIVLVSGKGTGKTNLIAQLLKDEPKVVSLGHRIALQRNVCERWGLIFRNDINAIKEITESDGNKSQKYSHYHRFGLCIDSILAVKEEDVRGGILVIDEFMQVLRHCVLGSTCSNNGQRSALIEHFAYLISIARQVILADADANDVGIQYIHHWRKDRSLCIIKNDYVAPNFEATFLETKKINDVYTQIIEDLNLGRKLFIATDSRNGSKKLWAKIKQECPTLKGLVINSETSSNPRETAFITNPNLEAKQYDWIIGTPSLGTGVSIEVEHFDKVYGIFQGILTDGDAAQALNRVRAKVPRIIWAAEKGCHLLKIHQSQHPRVIKRMILRRNAAQAALLRSQLGYRLSALDHEDDLSRSDHILDLYCALLAQDNASHQYLKNNLKARLRYEGSPVSSIYPKEHTPEFAQSMRDIGRAISQADALAIVQAPALSDGEAQKLARQTCLTQSEKNALEKRKIQAFFCKLDLQPEDIVFYGAHHTQIRQLEALLYGCEVSFSRDQSEMGLQLQWGARLLPWDLTCHELKRSVRSRLGLRQFLDPEMTWTNESTQRFADLVKQVSKDIKLYLNLTVPKAASSSWIISQLLWQLGLKVCSHSRGGRKKQVRIYSLDQQHLAKVQGILRDRMFYRLYQENQDAQQGIFSVCHLPQIDLVSTNSPGSDTPSTPAYLYIQEGGRYRDETWDSGLKSFSDLQLYNNKIITSLFARWLGYQDEKVQRFLRASGPEI